MKTTSIKGRTCRYLEPDSHGKIPDRHDLFFSGESAYSRFKISSFNTDGSETQIYRPLSLEELVKLEQEAKP